MLYHTFLCSIYCHPKPCLSFWIISTFHFSFTTLFTISFYLISHSLTLIPCLQLKYLFLTTSYLHSISHSLNQFIYQHLHCLILPQSLAICHFVCHLFHILSSPSFPACKLFISHNQIFSNSSSLTIFCLQIPIYIFLCIYSHFFPLYYFSISTTWFFSLSFLYMIPPPHCLLSSILHPISSHPPSLTISYPQSLNSSSHQTIHYCHLLSSIIILSLPHQNSIPHLLLLSNTPSLCLYNSYFIFLLIHFFISNTWSLAISFAWSLAWPLPLIIHISLPSALNHLSWIIFCHWYFTVSPGLFPFHLHHLIFHPASPSPLIFSTQSLTISLLYKPHQCSQTHHLSQLSAFKHFNC